MAGRSIRVRSDLVSRLRHRVQDSAGLASQRRAPGRAASAAIPAAAPRRSCRRVNPGKRHRRHYVIGSGVVGAPVVSTSSATELQVRRRVRLHVSNRLPARPRGVSSRCRARAERWRAGWYAVATLESLGGGTSMTSAKLAALGMGAMIAAGCGAPAPEPEPAADAAPEIPQFAVTGEHPCDPVGRCPLPLQHGQPRGHRRPPGRRVGDCVRGPRGGPAAPPEREREDLFRAVPHAGERVPARLRRAYPDCPGPLDLANPDIVAAARALPRSRSGRHAHAARGPPRPVGSRSSSSRSTPGRVRPA